MNMNTSAAKKNPHQIDGIGYLVRGVILFGAFALLFMHTKTNAFNFEGRLLLILFSNTLLLLGLSIYSIIRGGMIMFLRPTEESLSPQALEYGSSQNSTYAFLLEILNLKKISTYNSPKTNSIQHLLETLLPGLTKTPPYIRNIALLIFVQLCKSAFIYAIYIITILAGLIGISNFFNNSSANWIGWYLVLYQLYIWTKTFSSTFEIKNPSLALSFDDVMQKFVKPIAIASVIPFILTFIHLPNIQYSSSPIILIQVFLIALMCYIIYRLISQRIKEICGDISISEDTIHFSTTIRPNNIFNHIEGEISKLGYIRYSRANPELISEGSMNKGHFNGHALYETTNIIANELSENDDKKIITYGTIIGHSLFIFGGLWLLVYLMNMKTADILPLISSEAISGTSWALGALLINTSKCLYNEIKYKSRLIHIMTKGDYDDYSRVLNGDKVEAAKCNTYLTIQVAEIESVSCGEDSKRYIMRARQNDSMLTYLFKSTTNHCDTNTMILEYSDHDKKVASTHQDQQVSQNNYLSGTDTPMLIN